MSLQRAWGGTVLVKDTFLYLEVSTWIQYDTPESERSSAEWTIDNRPKRPKIQKSLTRLWSEFWMRMAFCSLITKENKIINSEYMTLKKCFKERVLF